MSPSPRRLGEFKKKQSSLESNGTATTVDGEIKTTDGTVPTASTSTAADGKFENISDNGSEISDEGYRSLGLIQQAHNSQSKRTSLHSQTSIEDGRSDDAKPTGEHSIIK